MNRLLSSVRINEGILIIADSQADVIVKKFGICGIRYVMSQDTSIKRTE